MAPQKKDRSKTLTESEQILGRRVGDPSPADPSAGDHPAQWGSYYRQLLKLRDHVLNQIRRMREQAASYEPKDLMQADAESATDEADRDFGFGMATNYHLVLTEIQGALKRIHDGSYGHCELTGKLIPAARLHAIPWTRFAAEGEEKLETQGRSPVPTTGLPSPELDFGRRLGPREEAGAQTSGASSGSTERSESTHPPEHAEPGEVQQAPEEALQSEADNWQAIWNEVP